jgi:hypothetical protein
VNPGLDEAIASDAAVDAAVETVVDSLVDGAEATAVDSGAEDAVRFTFCNTFPY